MRHFLPFSSWLRLGAFFLGTTATLSVIGAQAQTSDTTPATGTVDAPALDSHLANTDLTSINGTASDAQSNITKVEVNLYRGKGDTNNTNEYWNWTTGTWGNSSASTNKLATISGSTWSLTTGLPPDTNLRNGRYGTQAIITNGAGLKTTLSGRGFYIGNDTTPPTGVITTPAPPSNNQVTEVQSLSTISGTIYDTGDSGVGQMYVRLNRGWSGSTERWDGANWVGGEPKMPVTLSTPDANGLRTWSVNLPLPSGTDLPSAQYRVDLIAYDHARNYFYTQQNFVVLPKDTSKPEATITFPANGASLSRLLRIAGTATDEVDSNPASGLGRVDVQLNRTVGTNTIEYWNGSAWTTTVAYLADRTDFTNLGWIRNTSLPSGVNLPPGTYSIEVKAVDRYSNSSNAAISTFTISANHLPVAHTLNKSTGYGEGVEVKLHATDADSDDLTYQVATSPAHGTLSGTAPNLIYTPNSNWQGSDSFTFTASDPDGTSAPATVTITTLAPVTLDASITVDPYTTWVGDNIVNSTAVSQTQSVGNYVETTRIYHVALRKSGGSEGSQQVKITMPNMSSFPAGWGLRFYDHATGNQISTLPEFPVAPNAPQPTNYYYKYVTDTKTTVLRIEVDVPLSAPHASEASVLVRAALETSSEIVPSDTVQGTTRVRQITQPDVLVSRCDAAGVVQGPWVGEDQFAYYPPPSTQTTTIQRLTDHMVPGQARYFRAKVKNTGTEATYLTMTLSSRPTGWTTTVLNLNGTTVNSTNGWNTPVLAAGGSIEYLIKVETSAASTTVDEYDMRVRATSSTLYDQVFVDQTLRNASNSPLDVSIQVKGDTAFMGEDVINVTGAGQEVTSENPPGSVMEFVAKIENLSSSDKTYKVTAPAVPTGWGVQFLDANNNDIPTSNTGVAGWTSNVAVAANSSTTLNIKVTAPSSIPTPPSFGLLLQVTEVGDTSVADAVKAVALVSNNIQPDLSVRPSSAQIPNNTPWLGEGIIGSTTAISSPSQATQTLPQTVLPGDVKSYSVKLRNTSSIAGTFQVELATSPAGWTAQLFTTADPPSVITFDAQGRWQTPNLAAGASLELRLELTSNLAATSAYEAKVRAFSGTKSDQVTINSRAQKLSGIEWSRGGDEWHTFTGVLPVGIDHIVGLRAHPDFVASPNPSDLGWPKYSPTTPKWYVQRTDDIEKHISEEVWIHFPEVGTFSITVEAGDGDSKVVSFQVQADVEETE